MSALQPEAAAAVREFGQALRLDLSSLNSRPTAPDMAFHDRILVLPWTVAFIPVSPDLKKWIRRGEEG